MSTKKLLILTGVLLSLLAFVLFFERHQPTSEEKEKARRNLVDLKTENVVAVLIDRPDLPKLELVKIASRWKLQPAGATPGPADSVTADALVSDLARLEMVGEPRTSFDPKEFGLDKPKATTTITLKDGGKRTIAFGREIPGTDATASSEGGRFAAVKFAPMTTLAKPVDDFRSKQLVEVPSNEITRIELEKGPNKVAAVRSISAPQDGSPDAVPEKSEWRLEQPVADLANQTFVEQLVSDLSAARISEFLTVPKADLDEVGLEPPTATITVQKGAEVVSRIALGASKADATGKVYGRRDELTFLVDDRLQDDLAKELSAFRETKVYPVETWTLIRVSFDDGGLRTGAEKVEGEWRSSGRTVPATLPEDLVDRIGRAEVKSFVAKKDYAAHGIAEAPRASGKKASAPPPPLATLEFRREKDAAPLSLTFRDAKPYADLPVVAVEATGRGDAMLVDRAVFEEVRAIAAKLRSGEPPAANPKPAQAVRPSPVRQ